MVTKREVRTLGQLMDAIAAGSDDPSEKGPVCVEITLREGKKVIGSYYHGDRQPDISDREDILTDDIALQLLVHRLIASGTPFVSETGSSDTVCTLEWTIGA